MAAIGLLCVGLFVILPAPGARAACPITDLSCVIDTAEETVETGTGVTDPIPEPVEEVTDPVVETVEEVVTQVEQTVEDVVETVEDTVGPVIDEVPGVIPDLSNPDRPVAENPPSPTDGQEGPVVGPGEVPSIDPVGAIAPAGVPVLAGVSSSQGPGVTLEASPTGSQGPERIGLGLGASIAALAFPLALALVVVGFLVAQDLLDRRDPKLALAPVGPDVLGFS